jgi:O-antigen/teichoic acid export membrane protein
MLIYGSTDKLLLGTWIDKNSLGLYDSSQRIVTMLTALAISLSPIMISKLSELSRGDELGAIMHYSRKSFEFVLYLSLPVSFGIAAISPQFVPWFFGIGFQQAIPVLILLSPVILLAGVGDVFLNQLFISLKRDKFYLLVVVMMIVLTITLNFLLIPTLKHQGAAIASTITHFVVLVLEFFLVRDIFKWREVAGATMKCFFAASLMFLAIYKLNFMLPYVQIIFMKIAVGGAVYIVASRVFKVEMQLLLFKKLQLNFRKKFKPHSSLFL